MLYYVLKGDFVMGSKTVRYEIQMEYRRNGDWFGTQPCKNLADANKQLCLFRKNVKGNILLVSWKTRFRIRKITEEVLIECDIEA